MPEMLWPWPGIVAEAAKKPGLLRAIQLEKRMPDRAGLSADRAGI